MDDGKRKAAPLVWPGAASGYLQTQAARRYPGRFPPLPVSFRRCEATVPYDQTLSSIQTDVPIEYVPAGGVPPLP